MVKNYWIHLLIGCVLCFAFSYNVQAQVCKQFGGPLNCSRPTFLYANNLEQKTYATPQGAASGLAQFIQQSGLYNVCNGSVYYGFATRDDGTPYPRTAPERLNDPATDGNFVGVVIEAVRSDGIFDVCSSNFWYISKVPVCPIGSGIMMINNLYMCVYSNMSKLPTFSGVELPDVALTGDTNEEGCIYGCNPVNLVNGSKVEYEIDYENSSVFPIVWSRRYNNQNGGWFFSYSQKLTFEKKDGVDFVSAWRENGSSMRYIKINNNWQSTSKYVLTQLSQTTSGWVLTQKNGMQEFYSADGMLTKIRRKDGEEHIVTRDDLNRIVKIEDKYGYNIVIEYNKDNYSESDYEWKELFNNEVVTRAGKLKFYANNQFAIQNMYPAHIIVDGIIQTSYEWNLAPPANASSPGFLLTLVNHSSEKITGYMYGENSGGVFATDLVGKVDGNGVQYAKYEYQGNNSTVFSVQHGTTNDYIQYSANLIRNPNGKYVRFNSDQIDKSGKLSGQMEPCGTCGGLQANDIQYDDYGNPIAITDFDGRIETRTYDGPRGLILSKTQASGTALQKTTTWTWHPTLPVPLAQVEPIVVNGAPHNKTTTWTYNAQGNPLTQSESVSSGEPSRTTTFTYTSAGDVQSVTHPSGKVDRFNYNTRRQLISQIEGYGSSVAQTTTYGNYDAHGYFNAVTLPDGATLTVVRDGLHRIRSLTKNKSGIFQTTTVAYDLAGLMTESIAPNGQKKTYQYDSGHRLIQTNVFGPSNQKINSTVLTYNTSNKVTNIEVKTPQNTTALTQSYQYDDALRVVAVVDAYNNETRSTLSAQGVVKNTTDPLSRTTTYGVDALARLTSIKDPANNTSALSYGPQNEIVNATDPRSVQTQYTYNGFGDVVSLVSPDAGTWTFGYNAAGLNTSRTDPRGVTQTLTYDPLERLIKAVYNGGTGDGLDAASITHNYVYDVCQNGKGMLCEIHWNEGSRSLEYDPLQRLSAINDYDESTGTLLSQTIVYDNAGNIASRSLPSGKVLAYGYNNGLLSSITYDGQSVANTITWTATDQLKSFKWGMLGMNGKGQSIEYDLNGNPTVVHSHLNTWNYTYDEVYRVTNIKHNDRDHDETHTYDLLDRLKTSSVYNWNDTLSFDYDPTGNRTSLLDTTNAGHNWVYALNSNRLLEQKSVSNGLTMGAPAAYQYDAMGNMRTFGTNVLTYNTAGRVSVWNNGIHITHMEYNPQGQRTKKIVDGEVQLEVYDELGRLLGVYQPSPSGIQVKEELVYLDGYRAIATARPTGSTTTVYPILTDRLQTPRFVVDPLTQNAVWSWNATEPFGTQIPVEDISGSLFIYDGRFPGQRFDSSTNAFHNGFRTYLPSLGRYIQSDPLGLEAGWNTYAYVDSNPLSGVDPLGLVSAFDPYTDKNLPSNYKATTFTRTTKSTGTSTYQIGRVKTDGPNGRWVDVFKQISGNKDSSQNCHGYALGLNYWIQDPTFIYEDEYEEVPYSQSTHTLYRGQFSGSPKHSGLNYHYENGIDMSFGKWGVLPTSVNAESNLRMWYTSTFYRKKGK